MSFSMQTSNLFVFVLTHLVVLQLVSPESVVVLKTVWKYDFNVCQYRRQNVDKYSTEKSLIESVLMGEGESVLVNEGVIVDESVLVGEGVLVG